MEQDKTPKKDAFPSPHLLSSLTCREKIMADAIAQTRAVLAALPLCAVSHTKYARQSDLGTYVEREIYLYIYIYIDI